MIKAVFLDFDGTIFSHSSVSIPASTIRAINELRKKGIVVFMCTGRAPGEMHQFDLSELKLDGWIMSNGQMILDEKGDLIYEKCIGDELKDRLVRIFERKTIAMYLINRDDIYLNLINDKVRSIQSVVSSGIPRIGEYQGEKLYMASAFFADKDDEKYMQEIKDLADITWWQEGCVDIVPKGISKINGIDEVLRIYGINREEAMGIGDGENDIRMLEHCGIAVAMGNSVEELKPYADYITDDIDEDGLYKALKHYGLIEEETCSTVSER